MKSVYTIQRLTLLCLMLAGWGNTRALADELPTQFASAARMSTTLSSRSVQLRPQVPVVPSRDGDTRFDLSVNNAPASQVFLQLGAGTHYNILIPPELSGSITVSLKNTTVPEALDTLRELFGYDYRITGNRVFVYPNTVQTRLFRINYLPGRRQGMSELSIASTSSQGGGNGGGSGGNNSGSGASGSGNSGSGGGSTTSSGSTTSAVRMTSDSDFWREVKDSLNAMIGEQNGRGVTLNPGAGVIVVRATPAELRQVAEYLRAIQVTIERQVMLEAKIVEVQLSKSYETGINWSLFRQVGGGKQVTVGSVAPGVRLGTTGTLTSADVTIASGASVVAESLGKGFYGLAVQASSFAALLSFLETQGNTQVLSSPRIAALNNQKAVLKVGSDDTFIASVTNNVTVVNNTTVNSPTVLTKTYFSGISLDVTPQIDENGTVMLHVHPAISVASTKPLLLKLGDSDYEVPGVAISINETDSMVRVRDGQIVAIGGLMQQTAYRDSSGVPGLSEAPVLGGFFRHRTSGSSKRELVILIKPTVISEDGRGPGSDEPATPLISSANDSN